MVFNHRRADVQERARPLALSLLFVKAAPSQNRALALDALRGLTILAMLLSGQLPFDQNALPAWMYHAVRLLALTVSFLTLRKLFWRT